MLLFAYRIDLTKRSWAKYTSNTSSIPFLAMFHGKWCEACKRVHPKFKLVQEEFADDPNIVLAGCNCGLQESLCKSVKLDNFPGFVSYYKGEKDDSLYLYDTPEIQNAADDLIMKSHNLSLTPLSLPVQYPYFLFGVNRSRSTLMHYAKRAITLANLTDVNCYYEVNRTNAEGFLLLQLDPYTQINFSDEFNTIKIRNFILSYATPIQKSWSLAQLQNWSMPFAIYMADPEHQEMIQHTAEQTYKQISWGSASNIGTFKFMSLFNVEQSDLPAIVFVYGESGEFSRFTNVDTPSKMMTVLQDRQAAPRYPVTLQEAHVSFARKALYIVLIGCIVIVGAVLYVLRAHYKKLNMKLD